jgi:hypothetical protein
VFWGKCLLLLYCGLDQGVKGSASSPKPSQPFQKINHLIHLEMEICCTSQNERAIALLRTLHEPSFSLALAADRGRGIGGVSERAKRAKRRARGRFFVGLCLFSDFSQLFGATTWGSLRKCDL